MPKLFSACSCDTNYRYAEPSPVVIDVNPDPHNFVLLKIEQVVDNVVVEVQYPNCTNFEGKKILLLRDMSVAAVAALKFLDPHFCDGETHTSPFARFEPTEDGWELAVACAEIM